jgi:phage-related minor tail protein
MGGQVSSNNPYIVGELGPELFVPSSSGKIVPNNQLSSGGGATFNITVNGAIDAEGTARSIIDVLNNSFYRGTGGATAFAS